MAQDSISAGGTETFGGVYQLFDPEAFSLGGPIIGQFIIGSAHIGIGADGKFHEHRSFFYISGRDQFVGPFLQSAYQKGVILVIFREGCDIGRAVFQLQIRVGISGKVYDFLGAESFQSLDTFHDYVVVVHKAGWKTLQGNRDIGQPVQGFAADGVGLILSDPEILVVFSAFSCLFFDIVLNQNGEGNKRKKKTQIHIFSFPDRLF